ncbi:MAG TPA: hypothetical protein VF077_08905 [Nitrospiraceae bacterium]
MSLTVQQVIDALSLIDDKSKVCKLVLDEDAEDLADQQADNDGYIVVPMMQVYEMDDRVQLQSFSSL